MVRQFIYFKFDINAKSPQKGDFFMVRLKGVGCVGLSLTYVMHRLLAKT